MMYLSGIVVVAGALTAGVVVAEIDPNIWASAMGTILVALGGFIVIVRGQSKATTKAEDIHGLVNSNMSKMFMALGISFVCIGGLVWYGINEAAKPKEHSNDK